MPRTLAQNAQYIAETIKPAIKSAIEAQGVTVPSTDSFLDYADRIGEIEGGGSGYQLKDLPTGAIATVTDAAELPLNALKVSVEAWQEGSGDPSPSNVRPIHGRSQATITDISNYYVGSPSFDGYSNLSLWTKLDETYRGHEVYKRTSAWNGIYKAITLPAGVYTFSVSVKTSDGANVNVYFVRNDSTATTNIDEAEVATTTNWARISATFEVLQKGTVAVRIERSTVGDIYISEYQIERGNTAHDYCSYQLKEYTHAFTDAQGNPLTVYGAEWDVVGGELKQTDGYIASYNGETLPSSWISDRDVYDGTNTPTIGAEVVYKLATPTTIDLSPLSIRLLEGTNNLYADCGEVIEGEYFSGSAKGYVDGIKYAGEGDGGIASYTNVKSADELLGATAITFEVYARIDSYVSKTSGAYARLMEFGNSQQTGRLGFIGLASDNDNNLCYWDDTADIASGIDTWTLGDTHLVSIVKTTAGALKIYVDGILKYTGLSTLSITASIIDYVTERGGYSSQVDSARQLNGEVYAWRVYGKELSAANIAQNLTADRSLYAR